MVSTSGSSGTARGYRVIEGSGHYDRPRAPDLGVVVLTATVTDEPHAPMSRTPDKAASRVVRAMRSVATGVNPALATRFAQLLLGKLGGAELVVTDGTGETLARSLAELFGRVDQRQAGDVLVELSKPGSLLLDGLTSEGSVVEILSDDRRFIVTSVSEELFRLGYRVVRLFHPVLGSVRAESNAIVDLVPARAAAHRESIVQLELDAVVEPARSDYVVDAIKGVLDDVLRATEDHRAIRAAMDAAAQALREAGEFEAAALVDWLESEHFVPLGCCEFVLEGAAHMGDRAVLRVDHGLGLLAEAGGPLRHPVPEPDEAPPVLVARTTEVSRVHRRTPVYRVDLVITDHGRPRVFRVAGVFTRAADSEPPATIPVLRTKLEAILERHDAVAGSYDEQTLMSLFDVLPRDELFCADVGSLDATIRTLLGDDRNRRIRVLVRPDEPSRSVSVLLALPTETYTQALRRRIEAHLLAQLDGDQVDTDLSIGNRSEALVRFLVRVRDGAPVPPGPFDDIAHEIRFLCRTWEERVEAELAAQEPDRGNAARLARRFGARFPETYRDVVAPDVAARDIAALRDLEASGRRLEVRFVPSTDGPHRCRVYSRGDGEELSRLVPVFESLGLWAIEAVPWDLEPGDLHVDDFALRLGDSLPAGCSLDVVSDGPRLAAAMEALLGGEAEVDSLNRLVIAAELAVEQVTILRAYRRYRRQVTGRYSADYVNDVLVGNPALSALLVRYFEARFTPSSDESKAELLHAEAVAACDDLARLDDDRILRGVLGTIDATLRTNVLGRTSGPLALKLDSAAVPDMPTPTPYREVFVHGLAVEGIHLRFGEVARGGIRWSERVDDYRTEILDLAHTQVMKNALIVPTGAKGGFVLRRPVQVQEGYEQFISGLLDVTDNLRVGSVEAVEGRHDGDDPYLVVAADKGTAAFSDVANGLALERGFWLGDAFASGGSNGYDHKALGVTARGAWVAVQRHFQTLGVDVQSEPIRVVGIGDMSGDVFGNGMLQSSAIELVAAFDHRHIFCDPDPDPLMGHAERRRLFDEAGSSWDDYDRSLISEGGGVWPRTAKRIDLHPRLREALRTAADHLTPPELIQAILRAPVDLLFAGGIGTFVRASNEDDVMVDDRANSDLRVEASSLRARVVGEGANLAFTPRARVEYARKGGRINLDAIDNSAGVDTSDHEVNLKILLGVAVDAGELDDAGRVSVLHEVTDDVVADVLDATGRQCDALTIAQAESAEAFDAYTTLLDDLVQRDLLDLHEDALPAHDDLIARHEAGAGLTRPELGVLLAATKRMLRAAVLASRLPDDPALRAALESYFPPAVVRRFDRHLDQHRLRRELVATVVVNEVVDRCGIATVHRLADETGAGLAEVVAAAWTALQVGQVASSLTGGKSPLDAGRSLADLFATLTRRYLLTGSTADIAGVVGRDAAVAAELAMTANDPADLEWVPSVAALADHTGRSATEIADAFTEVTNHLGLARLRDRLNRTQVDGRWSHSFRAVLLADAARVRDAVTTRALDAAPGEAVGDAVAAWVRANGDRLAHLTRVRREVEADRSSGLDGLAVLVRSFRGLLE
jgi:glutamate dehydrogenase